MTKSVVLSAVRALSAPLLIISLLDCSSSSGSSGQGGAGGNDDAGASGSTGGTAGATSIDAGPKPDTRMNVGGGGAAGSSNDAGGFDTIVPKDMSSAGPSFDGGVDPSKLTLVAYGANQTIGLEWPRTQGATGYKLYWSNSAGVTPQSGTAIMLDTNPTYVHRGLTNGMDYFYVITAVTAAGEGPPSAQATAKPGGEWALEALGAGDFDDIVTGARVPRVPIAKRVQVLLLAEGYLQTELPIFHDHAKHNLVNPTTDVDRWQKELFALEPYSKFQEAFVIWYLPRASAAHTGAGTSAFGTEVATATAPLFAALDNAGSDAFLFPPVAASRNYMAAFLVFDPASGRAGFSGHTNSCTSGGIRVGCSFGIDHSHEFTHAFANVRDEYLDNGNTSNTTSEFQNVVSTNKCDQLPWSHLLAGKGINNKAQLVGAFGRPQQGYHSELVCQMNGTHDNGAFYCSGETVNMRVNRFCNFCRELIAFHVMYRTEILSPATEAAAFQPWKTTYRQPFFTRFGFSVPATVPQTVGCKAGAKPVVEECVP